MLPFLARLTSEPMSTFPSSRIQVKWQFKDDLSITRGKHNLKDRL